MRVMGTDRVPQIRAYIWSCDDDDCDCQQPVIELVEANPQHPTWRLTTRLWEGTYETQVGLVEWLEILAELAFAASEFHVRLNSDWYGERVIPTIAAEQYRAMVVSR